MKPSREISLYYCKVSMRGVVNDYVCLWNGLNMCINISPSANNEVTRKSDKLDVFLDVISDGRACFNASGN